jgi:hypothetical protein
LKTDYKLKILEFYVTLKPEEKDGIFELINMRKIILLTNMAENLVMINIF